MRRLLTSFVAATFLACTSAAVVAQAPLQQPAEIPIEITNNHIYVPVSVNHSPASAFILDTGAGASALAQSTADAVHLRPSGKSKAGGAGPAVVQTTIFRDVALNVGALSFDLSQIAALPLTTLSLLEGRLMEGVIGYNVLTRYVIDVDYERRVARFYDRATYVPSPQAVALPITFSHNHPVIGASLTLQNGENLSVRLMVDSGAGGSILINRPFAERHRVYDALTPSIEGSFAAGIGGVTYQHVGRAKRFEIGGFAFDAPVVAASRDSGGFGSTQDVDGLIGGEVLRRFTLTVDYPHRRLLIAPNKSIREPFEFDMAGVFLKAVDTKFNRFVIRELLPNAPGTEAGLAVGDEILSIDDQRVSAMTLDAIRKLFHQPDRRYVVRILRGGQEIEIPLVTRRLL